MVPSYWFSTFAALLTSAFFLTAGLLMSSDPLIAAEAGAIQTGGVDLRASAAEPALPLPPALRARPLNDYAPVEPASPQPTLPRFDVADELATLEALQVTLSEVGDGSTFVWHRRNGRVSGMFQPTRSFKDDAGKICRHFRMMLTSAASSRRIEAIACRGPNGVWNIDG